MRDDFSGRTKELLAKRMAFLCSNPECRQVTSGPQEDATKAINVGVAAHITAASPDGPRFDPSLSTEERRSAGNGIWQSQTCAKLVDNDPIRYSVSVLRQWKDHAETEAARDLERRNIPVAGSNEPLQRLERLMPDLLAEMRNDLAENPLSREFVILKRAWSYWASGGELVYYLDDHPDLENKLHILQNYGLIHEITYNNVQRYVITEELASYLGAG